MSVINSNAPSDPEFVHNTIPTDRSEGAFEIQLLCTDESVISGALDSMLENTIANTNSNNSNNDFVDSSGVLIASSYAQTTGYQYEITNITCDNGVYEYATEGNDVSITIPTIEGLRDPVLVSGQYRVDSFPLIHYSTASYLPPNFPARDDEDSVAITLPDSIKWPPYNDATAPVMTYFAIDTRHDKDVLYTCGYTLHDHYNDSDSVINISYLVKIHNNTGEVLGVDLKTFFSSL